MEKYFYCEIAHTSQCPERENPIMQKLLLKEGTLGKEETLTINDFEAANALCQHCKYFIPTE